MKEIPKDELQYWNLVKMSGEGNSVIFGIVHETELDPECVAIPLHKL